MKTRLFFVLLCSLWMAPSVYAVSLPLHPNQNVELLAMSPDVEANAEYDFEGIVALSNCSGSIIRYEKSKDDQQALILTNGHCVKLMSAKQVMYNQPAHRKFAVLDSKAKKIGRVTADRILYATMNMTDMAIYRLKETYAEIEDKFNVRPLTLAEAYADRSADIQILSGYWKKGYTCEVEEIVSGLKEHVWFWKDSIRYSRPGCEIINGTSGSPVLLSGSRTVIGVNNTFNEDGKHCTKDNPCEVSEEGEVVLVEKGYSYGQQTSWIYSCLNEELKIDLEIEGCSLPS